MTQRKSTSIRFSDAELELLDALAEVRRRRTSVRHGRAETIRWMLQQVHPSDELDPAHSRHRDAYKVVFG